MVASLLIIYPIAYFIAGYFAHYLKIKAKADAKEK
jgi:hypothetical protein